VTNSKVRILRIRDQIEELSRSLTEPGRDSIDALEIQLFQLEEQVIDRTNYTADARVPTTAH
jgi:hypothetical protein